MNLDNKQNPNTQKFWEEKLRGVLAVQAHDFITKSRIDEVVKLIPNKELNLLDVGVGYGFLENAINRYRPESKMIGIDITPANLTAIRNRVRGSFVVGTASSLPLRQRQFDAVCILEVLEHLYFKEAQKALEESMRVLKSDGILIISVPLFDKPYDGHPSGHVREITPNQIIQEVNNAGFIVKKTISLVAFRSHYNLKTLINKILPLRKPNNLIIGAIKK